MRRARPRGAAKLFDETERAVSELPRARLHVDHAVAVDAPEACHARGRQRIEDELGRGARLEPRGAGEHLGPRAWIDHHTRSGPGGCGVASHQGSDRPTPARRAQRRADEWRHAARGYADDDIAGPHTATDLAG